MATIVLGGTTFHVGRLPSAWQSFALQPLFGPGVMELFGVFEALPRILDGKSLSDMETMDVIALVPHLAPVVGRALSKIPTADLERLTRELFSATTAEVNGKPVQLVDVFASLMQGRTFDTWRLLFAAFKENYPDFFDLFAAKGDDKPAVSDSKGSTTSRTSRPATG